MGNKIRENSEEISFFIELCFFILIGVVAFNFLFGLIFKYIANSDFLSHSKFIKFSYTQNNIKSNKNVVTLNPEEKAIKIAFTDLYKDNQNISNILSQNYMNSLYAKYQSKDYVLDIKKSLGIYNIGENIKFVKQINNSYLIYFYIGKSKLYLRVYFQKVLSKIEVTGIVPSES